MGYDEVGKSLHTQDIWKNTYTSRIEYSDSRGDANVNDPGHLYYGGKRSQCESGCHCDVCIAVGCAANARVDVIVGSLCT